MRVTLTICSTMLASMRTSQHWKQLTASVCLSVDTSVTVQLPRQSVAAVEKLSWLHLHKSCPLPTLSEADLEVFFWPLQDITATAAASGSTEVLRWLKQHGCVFSQVTSHRAAAQPDNLKVLQYLVEEDCPLGDAVCAAAVRSGDLEQLKWVHAHGGILDTDTAVSAASNGAAVPTFEWLQQQGCSSTSTL
jgi:hypothetical protein